MRYVIQVNGKRYVYETMEAAKAAADAIFSATGIVVGITQTRKTVKR